MFTYDEALNFILNRQSLGIKPGLSRIKSALDMVDNPQDKIKIIHIAGTNGKGTVAHTIARALRDNGLRVGLFTSPWIRDYREQIMINDEPIPKDRFAKYVEGYQRFDCTEFELVTLIMYSFFADEKVDYAVVECGMGGKGDATNVERDNIAVLTSISLDHTDFLGSTIEEITKEKEGIIRSVCFRYEDTGDFNADNLTLAKRVVKHLGYDDDIKLVKPVARQQRLGKILLDGGHNLQAGKALAPIIDDEVAVVGMMRDKDVDGYLSCVAPKCKRIICTNVNNPRAISATRLCEIARKYCTDVQIVDNPRDIDFGDVSLVCGSFYLVREIIDLIS